MYRPIQGLPFGCLKGVLKSVQVLLDGIDAAFGADFNISEMASTAITILK